MSVLSDQVEKILKRVEVKRDTDYKLLTSNNGESIKIRVPSCTPRHIPLVEARKLFASLYPDSDTRVHVPMGKSYTIFELFI